MRLKSHCRILSTDPRAACRSRIPRSLTNRCGPKRPTSHNQWNSSDDFAASMDSEREVSQDQRLGKQVEKDNLVQRSCTAEEVLFNLVSPFLLRMVAEDAVEWNVW